MIGERVKRRRMELGMTQEELAKRMGYKSKSTINKIEKGINDVSQSKMLELAAILHCDVTYFIYGETEMDSYSKLARYAQLYLALNENNRQIVTNLAENLYKTQGGERI